MCQGRRSERPAGCRPGATRTAEGEEGIVDISFRVLQGERVQNPIARGAG